MSYFTFSMSTDIQQMMLLSSGGAPEAAFIVTAS